MPEFLNFLEKLDPNHGLVYLFWFTVMGGSGFFVFRVWPWLTTVYWPARLEQQKLQIQSELSREDKQTRALETIGLVLAELKQLYAQSFQQLSMQLEAHDAWAKGIAALVLTQKLEHPEKP